MKKIELEIVALSPSITQSHSYAVVLGEVNGIRKLPIVIGGFEAQAIAVALEGMNPSRPLTHDLMKSFMTALGVELQEIIISEVTEGIFISKLVCFTVTDTIEIDSRTSDALALAVRFGCPIYTYEHIIKNLGVNPDEPSGESSNPIQRMQVAETEAAETAHEEKDLSKMTTEELNQLLNEILEQEDYVRAIAIRDELNKRK